MIDKDTWMAELIEKLRATFRERLLFVGLQGSYRRGEATERSDIDVVVVLDHLDVEDLSAYRSVIASMPQSDKACGFIAGKQELAHWPKYEIFQLAQETEEHFGNLAELLPSVCRADVEESVKIAAAGGYHALCHTFLYASDPERLEALKGACKSAFFILQLLHFLRTGTYVRTKKALLPLLDGDERDLLEASIGAPRDERLSESDMEVRYRQLIAWYSTLLKRT